MFFRAFSTQGENGRLVPCQIHFRRWHTHSLRTVSNILLFKYRRDVVSERDSPGFVSGRLIVQLTVIFLFYLGLGDEGFLLVGREVQMCLAKVLAEAQLQI